MTIKTTVEFFWGAKTFYETVVLYPDNRIEFPDHDIESDIIAAELGDEPTQQCELYEAYTEHGILGFSRVGKESYFWDSDYYLLDKKPREKKIWAEHICRNLYDYLYNDDAILYNEEIEFPAKLVNHFAETSEILYKGCSATGEVARRLLFVCRFDFLVNGSRCFSFREHITGTYAEDYRWTHRPSGKVRGHQDMNISEFFGELYEGELYPSDVIKDLPEPYQVDEYGCSFNPLKGFAGSAKYGLVIMGPWDNIEFCAAYETMEQLEASLAYVFKWLDLSNNVTIFHKESKGDNFFCRIASDHHGDAVMVVPDGWSELGMG